MNAFNAFSSSHHHAHLALLVATFLTGLGLTACGGGSDSTTAATTTTTTSTTTTTTDTSTTGTTATSTAGVLCNYATSAFNSTASVNKTATANWSCSSTLRSLTANGLPDHEVGTFPNNDNPNTIAAQSISASVTVTPTATSVVTPRVGAMDKPGVALNGIAFDPGTAGTCSDAGACQQGGQSLGSWSLEALGQTFFKWGTDTSNAHVQPNGMYHYHGIPEGLVTKLGNGNKTMTLIGWAADGFPIYARYGYTVATDASSAIKVVMSSYRTKTAPGANRPATTTTYAMGTFTQDYEYVAGLGDLDECNGRTGVTPEFPKGIYHYYATDTFPHLQRCVKGTL
jgi:YHYH protein